MCRVNNPTGYFDVSANSFQCDGASRHSVRGDSSVSSFYQAIKQMIDSISNTSNQGYRDNRV
nr:MAG TPA: hypothetical protein [Caudoviricetes sp.]